MSGIGVGHAHTRCLVSHPKGVISNIVSRGKLAGTALTDSTSDPIQNATVVLHWNRPGEGQVPSQVPPNEMKLGDTRLKTDMLGKFSASLTPGFYDVTVLVRRYDAETHALIEVGEIHWDLSETFGTAQALESLGTIPESISLDITLGTECGNCHKPVKSVKPHAEQKEASGDGFMMMAARIAALLP